MTFLMIVVSLAVTYFAVKFLTRVFSKNEDMQMTIASLCVILVILAGLVKEGYKKHDESINKIKQYFRLTDEEINRLKPKDFSRLLDKIYEIETKDIKEKIKDAENYR